jgi:hypothetical protein
MSTIHPEGGANKTEPIQDGDWAVVKCLIIPQAHLSIGLQAHSRCVQMAVVLHLYDKDGSPRDRKIRECIHEYNKIHFVEEMRRSGDGLRVDDIYGPGTREPDPGKSVSEELVVGTVVAGFMSHVFHMTEVERVNYV